MKKKPKTKRIAQIERSKQLEQEKKNAKNAKNYLNKTIEKFQDQVTSGNGQLNQNPEKFLEFNRISNTPSKLHTSEILGELDSHSLAKIKQNMELLNGDLALGDLELQLNPNTLDQRYNPDAETVRS